MEKTTAQLTIEIFESLGMTDKQAWEMMNKKAKENGFDSYAGMPNVTKSKVQNGRLIEASGMINILKEIKKDNSFTYNTMVQDIRKKIGEGVKKYTLHEILLRKKGYIREGLFDIFLLYTSKYGYKVSKQYFTQKKRYIKDEKIAKRLKAYKEEHKITVSELARRINRATKEKIGERPIRNAVGGKPQTKYTNKTYKILTTFLQEVGY